jgi:GNAT superfamily N-acetyltransferase
VTVPWVRVAKLEPQHDIDSFSCGFEQVDNWLHDSARGSERMVATHVCLDDTDQVRAFFALKTIIVQTEGMNSVQRRGTSDGVATGILLCQMGLNASDRGNGVGGQLMRSVFTEAAKAHAISPVNLFVVDAANEQLVDYYERAGLRRVPTTLRLAAPMNAVVKSLSI